MKKLRQWLATLSFRTGLTFIAICITCYIISFAQMLLPISITAKTILWATLFGAAKATQYTALLILGKAGLDRLRQRLRRT